MLGDRRHQLGEAVAGLRGGPHDRWHPRCPALAEPEHLREVARRLVRSRTVRLVHDDDVRDLEDARLDRLDVVAEPRDRHETDGIGHADDVHLLLPDADGLHEHHADAERVEHVHHAHGRAREAAGVAAARHAADEKPLVEEAIPHADAVAEDRPARERARGIDGDDRDACARLAVRAGEPVHEGALAASRRAGDPDHLRAARLGIERAHRVGGPGLVVLHHREQARDGALVAAARPREEVARDGGRHSGGSQELAGDDDPLHLARAFADLHEPRVAEVPLDREVAKVAVAAQNLE